MGARRAEVRVARMTKGRRKARAPMVVMMMVDQTGREVETCVTSMSQGKKPAGVQCMRSSAAMSPYCHTCEMLSVIEVVASVAIEDVSGEKAGVSAGIGVDVVVATASSEGVAGEGRAALVCVSSTGGVAGNSGGVGIEGGSGTI